MRNQPSGHTGRHFLQIPGPTNVPDRVLQAIAIPTIDHRGPEFGELGKEVVAGMKRVFQTDGTVVIYPSSGTGAWEAALVNTLSPGDRVLMFETGHFATLVAADGDPARPRDRVRAGRLAARRRPGAGRREAGRRPASTGSRRSASSTTRPRPGSPAASRRSAPRSTRRKHPALFMVDTISSLASIDYRHDEWRVDVTVAGSQKGLMLPPGLGFNAVSDKALAAGKTARLPRSYWDWEAMLETGHTGFFPYTPATNLLFGLREALDDAARRGGAAGGVPPPRPARRGDPARRRRLGPRGAVRRSARVFELADRGRGARRL